MKGFIKNRRHGLSKHPLYTVWMTMIHSCYNEKHLGFSNNGALGIKVCERWLLVENFIEDVGLKVEGMYFIKKDNNDDFNPNNWEWVPKKKIIRKSRITKLSKEQVLAIRKERLTTNHSGIYLAKKYKCSGANISSIVNNKTWVD